MRAAAAKGYNHVTLAVLEDLEAVMNVFVRRIGVGFIEYDGLDAILYSFINKFS
jgi:hypothetical protein